MKHITFYLDFISPYAYLAFEALPVALKGLSYSVAYQPVLFAGMLKHHGQLGPAEIASKREWTYRHVLWLAHSQNVAMKMPASHPFNPLQLLRLAVASGLQLPEGRPNRYVCESIFRHVWRDGGEAADALRLASLAQQLAQGGEPVPDLQAAMQGEDVKARLKANTEEAIALGVFGVPAFEVDGKVFWGLDSLPMLRACLVGSAWFDGPDWNVTEGMAVGVVRKA